MLRLDLERLAVFAIDCATLEDDIGRLNTHSSAFSIAREDQLFALVKTVFGELELVGRYFLQRIEEKPFDERIQFAVALQDDERVMVPAVLAQQAAPFLRARLRFRQRNALIRLATDMQFVAALLDFQAVIDIYRVINDEAIAQLSQLAPNSAAIRQQPQVPIALKEIKRAIAALVTTGQGASLIDGERLRLFDGRQRLGFLGGEHLLQGDLSDVIGHTVGDIARSDHDHAELLLR